MTTLIPKVKQPATGAVNQPINIKLNEAISVKDFGAVGDGVADDSAAIQAAITYADSNRTGSALNQLGGIVYFPQGRYLVKATVHLPVGITIKGEPSGLGGYAPSAIGSGTQIVASTTLTDGSPWNNSAIFDVPSGGPITLYDIGLNGTSTVTNSCGILCGTGAGGTGVSQAHFTNVRFVAFTDAIKGTRFSDCTFYDCGFESNVNCLLVTAGAVQSFDSVKFIGCIFFASTAAVISVSNATVAQNIIMSGCIFQDQIGLGINQNVFNVYGGLTDVAIVGCYFSGNAGSFIFDLLSSTGSIVNVNFTGNNVRNYDLANIQNFGAGLQCFYLNITGNILHNSSFNSAYSINSVIYSNNTVRAGSTFNASSLNYLSINDNDFSGNAPNPPIVLTDVFSNLSISNNVFPTAVTLIPVNITSTYVKMIGNTSFADFSSNAIVTNANATYTVLANDETIIQTTAASVYTLPTATSWKGRKLTIVSNFAGTVTSATSNVVGITGGAAGTAILAATSGKWATLQSNGVSWIIIASN